MFDTVLGLPVHVLVIHGVVVLIPVAATAVIASAVFRRWRQRLAYVVAGLTTLAVIGAFVAIRSGKALEQRLNASGVVAEQIDRHADAGNLLLWPVIAMWVLTVVLVVMHRQQHPALGGAAGQVINWLAAVFAAVAIVLTGVVGHLGATAVWSCTIGSPACE